MKKTKYTEEQIVYAIQQAEAGVPVGEQCRKYGISEPTIYRWREKFGGLTPIELPRMGSTFERPV